MTEQEKGSPWALGVVVSVGMLILVRCSSIETAAQPQCSQQGAMATAAIGSTLNSPEAETAASIPEACQ
ncbi:MAG TPA: hypothetical protein V6C84_29805 [Coleofasciculaceae cyanobacterium]|jgi:hypothetical protein